MGRCCSVSRSNKAHKLQQLYSPTLQKSAAQQHGYNHDCVIQLQILYCTVPCPVLKHTTHFIMYVHCVQKKWYIGFLVITSPNVNRFLKLFHCQIYKETLCVPVIRTSTSFGHTLLHTLRIFKIQNIHQSITSARKKN